MTFLRAAIRIDTSDELYGPILGVLRMAALFHRPTNSFLQNLTHTTPKPKGLLNRRQKPAK